MARQNGFSGRIDHIVVVMMENRSFDNLLGWLYDPQNPDPRFREPPRGQAFEGLAGTPKFNPLPDGTPAYATRGSDHTMPYPDPNEAYNHVYAQQFDVHPAPDEGGVPNTTAEPSMRGFAIDYADAIQEYNAGHTPLPTQPQDIMQCFPPAQVPISAGLARAYAVCDHWFASVPTETFPNRSFVHAGTSSGYVYNSWGSLFHLDPGVLINDTPTVFNALEGAGRTWRVYHGGPRLLCAALVTQKKLWEYALTAHFAGMDQFRADAASGGLPAYSFLEPNFFNSCEYGPENDMHPDSNPAFLRAGMGISNVLNGEILLYQVYQALRDGPAWDRTLLVVTFDEHGGCFDHVPPPQAVSPDGVVVPPDKPGGSGFDFQRLGVRVPGILVSPWIEEGTVFSTPLDHTSVIRSVFECFGVPGTLLDREAQAASLAGALSLDQPRTDRPVLHPLPPPQFDPLAADMELGHLQLALVRAAHVHAGAQQGRELSLGALAEMVHAVADPVRTRQDAVTHFRRTEDTLFGRR
jgi:phospholipase C